MKSPAIVSFLWESQVGVLREFFRRHGPMTLVTYSPYVSQALIEVVDQAGGQLFVIDREVAGVAALAVDSEIRTLREGYDRHLSSGLVQSLPGEDDAVVAAIIAVRVDAELPILVTLLHGLQLASERYQLCLMIGSEDVMPVARVAMHWARQHGVPSLHLSHALALNDPHNVHAQLVADIHAVYGQRGLEGYLDYGVPAERMRVTGNPAWDRLVSLRAEREHHAGELRERHGLREGQPVVVFGTTWTSRLSAHGDERIFGATVGQFIDACEALRRSGVHFNPIVKDRPPNFHFGARRFRELLAERGADPQYYFYLVEDGPLWAATADVLIAVDSNYCVEAMLCGTPTINLQHSSNTVFGPSYEGGCGVQDVESGQLAQAIGRLLADDTFRQEQLCLAERNSPYFNLGVDGNATQRVVELMSEMAVGMMPKLLVWLESRLPCANELALIETKLREAGSDRPLLGIQVLDQGDADALRLTLDSLDNALPAPMEVQVIAATGAAPYAALAAFIESEACQCHWVLPVLAGVEFTRAGPLLLSLELAQALSVEKAGGNVVHGLYADELQRTPSGALGAVFRPDFNLDMLLACPAMLGRHWALRRQSYLELGGLETAFDASSLLDMLLRLVQACAGNGLLHVPEVLLIADQPALGGNPAEQVAIERHLQERGYEATVSEYLPGRYQIDYGHPGNPAVTVVVAVHDNLALLQRCVESLLEKTSYSNYQVLLVDCDSQDLETRVWLDGIDQLQSEQVKVWRFAGPLNAPAMFNAVAASVDAEYLVLLAHDAQIVQKDWLEQLLNHAQRPEVGAVGARIANSSGHIEQAGIVLGLYEVAGRAFANEPLDAPGYLGRMQLTQNYSALGAACLMVRRSTFIELGGMDETSLSAFYADVDFCLRLRTAGLLNVWTPLCTVVRESVELPVADASSPERQRELLQQERDVMLDRWLPLLARDPAYNINLSLKGNGFLFEYGTRRVQRPLLPQVLCHPADAMGCGHYRVRQPLAALRGAGLVDGQASDSHLLPVELERMAPDAIVFQRQITEAQIASMREVKRLSGAFRLYELDDYLPNLPLKSWHREDMPRDVLRSLRTAVSLVDRFVVSSEPLAEALADLHDDIRVAHNYLPPHWWSNLHSQRRQGRRPRVGWAGGISHQGDLELILGLLRELHGEVEWVFMGMCPEPLRPYVQEFHTGVAIDQYPAKLASLNLDLALAPLEQNRFNECKSNLRLLEYGACGYPVICSDIAPYRGALPVTRVKNRFKDWLDAVRMHLADLDASARLGDELNAAVRRDWMLEGDNLQKWRDAWLPH